MTNDNIVAKKSLGQHWLNDATALQAMVDSACIESNDTVLEIGPGLGSLTKYLLERAGRVMAIEKDEVLAANLKLNAKPNLQVVTGDILKFDLTQMPAGYKLVANIPYYLSSHLLRLLTDAANPPSKVVLLLQKEVAQRVCSEPGQMSILAVATQLFYFPSLGIVVPAKLFEPPPKVDSQILILDSRSKPIFADLDQAKYLRIVKAGFAGKRKKLRSSLAAGLQLTKEQSDELLLVSGIDGDLRAQNLSLQDWYKIYSNFPN